MRPAPYEVPHTVDGWLMCVLLFTPPALLLARFYAPDIATAWRRWRSSRADYASARAFAAQRHALAGRLVLIDDVTRRRDPSPTPRDTQRSAA